MDCTRVTPAQANGLSAQQPEDDDRRRRPRRGRRQSAPSSHGQDGPAATIGELDRRSGATDQDFAEDKHRHRREPNVGRKRSRSGGSRRQRGSAASRSAHAPRRSGNRRRDRGAARAPGRRRHRGRRRRRDGRDGVDDGARPKVSSEGAGGQSEVGELQRRGRAGRADGSRNRRRSRPVARGRRDLRESDGGRHSTQSPLLKPYASRKRGRRRSSGSPSAGKPEISDFPAAIRPTTTEPMPTRLRSPTPESGAKRTAEPMKQPLPIVMSRSCTLTPWVKNWLARPAIQVPSPTVMPAVAVEVVAVVDQAVFAELDRARRSGGRPASGDPGPSGG